MTGPVIARAAQVLAAFTRERPSLSLSELARRVGIPVSTAHRLVGDLVDAGWLERESDGRYHVGLRLWEIGSLAPRGLGLREVALPIMEDLFSVVRENVQLAVRDGDESVFVERIAGRGSVPVLTQVGGRFPLHATGVGRVLLAYAPADVQDRVLTAPMERHTEHTITAPAQLRRMLADVRRDGYAVNERQVTTDTLSVAAPVRDGQGNVVAALSVVVPIDAMAAAALAPAVQAAALAISRLLAGGGAITLP